MARILLGRPKDILRTGTWHDAGKEMPCQDRLIMPLQAVMDADKRSAASRNQRDA
jgi:hypothetical protein